LQTAALLSAVSAKAAVAMSAAASWRFVFLRTQPNLRFLFRSVLGDVFVFVFYGPCVTKVTISHSNEAEARSNIYA
jgi:hypothetical protein